jgi:5-formyltetrahydrofolate cyclo-ligase
MTSPDKIKAELRQSLRQRRRALGEGLRAAAAQAVADALPALPEWPRRRRIALYLPADGELDPGTIARHCRQQARSLYLPRVDVRGIMSFSHWHPDAVLTANRYGIPEPPACARRLEAAELDLIFMPLVGWDRRGNRLGMGGGYYDRALADARRTPAGRASAGRASAGRASPESVPLLVGLAFSAQEVSQLPAQAWDIRLDFVLTERGLHRCEAGR